MAPKRREVYQNVYNYGVGNTTAGSLEGAKLRASSSAIAVLRLTYSGDNLEAIEIAEQPNQKEVPNV
jgi:hypothetical protein